MTKQNRMVIPETPTNLGEPGWKTSEFAAVSVTVVTNLIAILVVMGLVPAGDQSGLTQALAGITSGAMAIISNGVIVWQYVRSRTEVKTAVANMQASLAMERFHVRIEKEEDCGNGCCQ